MEYDRATWDGEYSVRFILSVYLNGKRMRKLLDLLFELAYKSSMNAEEMNEQPAGV